jgi:hypothetical protein
MARLPDVLSAVLHARHRCRDDAPRSGGEVISGGLIVECVSWRVACAWCAAARVWSGEAGPWRSRRGSGVRRRPFATRHPAVTAEPRCRDHGIRDVAALAEQAIRAFARFEGLIECARESTTSRQALERLRGLLDRQCRLKTRPTLSPRASTKGVPSFVQHQLRPARSVGLHPIPRHRRLRETLRGRARSHPAGGATNARARPETRGSRRHSRRERQRERQPAIAKDPRDARR